MFYLITVCVLAVVAVSSVAVALSISFRRNLASWQQALLEYRASVKLSETTQLRVDLDALAADVAKLSRSSRKQFGGVWAEIVKLRPPEPEAEQNLFEDDDENDAAAMLKRSPDARARLAGEQLERMGIGRVPAGTVCACGWCASCVEKRGATQ